MIRSKILLVRLTRVVQETSRLFHVQFLASCKQLVRNLQCTRMLHGKYPFVAVYQESCKIFSLAFCRIFQVSCRNMHTRFLQDLTKCQKKTFSCKNAHVLQDCFYWAVASFHAVCKALRDIGWLALSACHILLPFGLPYVCNKMQDQCNTSYVADCSQPHLSRHLIWPE